VGRAPLVPGGPPPVYRLTSRAGGGSISLMADLSALTPPFLVAAVVIIAIAAFLRHEMGRGRTDRADPEDISAPDPDPKQDS
jgi:hypothetical protein